MSQSQPNALKNICLKDTETENTGKIEMPRLTSEQRLRAIGMLEAGRRQTEVAAEMGCTQSTICKLLARYTDTGVVRDRPRSGRPPVTTPNQDRYIVLQHLRDRFLPATRTAAATPGRHNRRISASTVRRRLRRRALAARRPCKGPVLNQIHRRNRLRWCQLRQRWTQRQWNQVLFSDESRFCLSFADGRQRVWRKRGERFARCCIKQFNRWGGPGVLVWAGISSRFRTPLVVVEGNLTARRYVDEILRPHLLPFLEAHPTVRLFQQDNARPHVARLTLNFLQEQEVEVLPWVACSPDLNPLEHIWDELGRRLYARMPLPQNRQMLIAALQEEWERMPQARIQKVIQSMRKRCVACVRALGGHTRF